MEQNDLAVLENRVDEATLGFVVDMKYKLRLNNHKGHWKDYDITALVAWLDEEVRELKAAVHELSQFGVTDKRLLDVVHECADIGNFGMMIADNCKRAMREGTSSV